jgi:hypothetical protein
VSETLALPESRYIVVRSPVEEMETHGEYEPQLRIDFWFSCSYCTMCEAEARGIGFSIDHYEPQAARPDLSNVYSNLMYSCVVCNSFKWKWNPPSSARAANLRFFKADVDDASDHFTVDGNELRGRTLIGNFTIEALDLNRKTLVRIREIRANLAESLEEIAFGIRALKGSQLDKMSNAQKMRFGLAAHEMEADSRGVDLMLRKFCSSELLDEDDETKERTKMRRAHLRAWRVQFPDPWWPESKAKKTAT